MPHTDEQLEQLSVLLNALPIENDSMHVSDLDGFIAGLLVCPEMVMPSEWLPMVWGDDANHVFNGAEQMDETVHAVMDHYNRVAKLLAEAPEGYSAICGVDPNSNETLWEPWVDGFERAMRLRVDSWTEIIESQDEEAASSISMIVALHEINQGTSELSEESIDELDEIAPSLISEMTITLNHWVKSRHEIESIAANSNSTPHRSTKTGVNDPCPCGSGKKYKKCCRLKVH